MNPPTTHQSKETYSSPNGTTSARRRAVKHAASRPGIHDETGPPRKDIRRRASQACQSCRTRKIRCNVAKHGAPCVHCRLDEIECVVAENKRKKKRTTVDTTEGHSDEYGQPFHSSAQSAGTHADLRQYPVEGLALSPGQWMSPPQAPHAALNVSQSSPTLNRSMPAVSASMPPSHGTSSLTAGSSPILPAYIKPLPPRFGHDDITYLHNKGALAIPDEKLISELLRSYAEYMHPFMPLLDLHDFVRIVDQNSREHTVSLLLFQAVMFTGTATVAMHFLEAAGYHTRREARRAFYNKVRLLYDLDYEDDSVSLIQSLLLMTYWREEQNGRKETHHWMEVAVSLAQKIDLHRNSDQKLRRRIWWSAYVRDAQIALGARTSTRIKDLDFDVSMLHLADFDLDHVPDARSCIPADCSVVRDREKQLQLAVMCIEMAKLCLCVSHIVSVQYGVTASPGSMRTAAMLFGEAFDSGDHQTHATAKILQNWRDSLPAESQYTTPTTPHLDSNSPLVVNRAFLHMLYYAALSSLYRPQLQAQANEPPPAARSGNVAGHIVRLAATNISSIAGTLQDLDLVRYLPSPSITVLLPAIVIHLLDVVAPGEYLRGKSLMDFCKCMQIMAALRDVYAAADYSTAFLHSAIQRTAMGPLAPKINESKDEDSATTNAQGLSDSGPRVHTADNLAESTQHLPQVTDQVMDFMFPTDRGLRLGVNGPRSDENTDQRLNPYLMSPGPASNWHSDDQQHMDYMSYHSSASALGIVDQPNSVSNMDLDTLDWTAIVDHINGLGLGLEGAAHSTATGRNLSIGNGNFRATQSNNQGFLLPPDWSLGTNTQSPYQSQGCRFSP